MLLERVFLRVALFTTAREQIARLAERRADEVAGDRHSPIDLARALVAAAAVAWVEPVLAACLPL